MVYKIETQNRLNERKVLSFQRHYSIPPPGVKARFTIFSFLLSFLYSAPKAREYIFHFYASFYVCLCVLSLFFTECAGLGTPLRRFAPAPPQGEPSHHRQQRQSWRSGRGSEKFASPQSFSLFTGVTWLPPWDCAAEARPADERVLRTKQPKRSRGSGLLFASGLPPAQQKQGTATPSCRFAA